MTRSVMLNVLADDYVRTARAKGLADRTVLIRHALRPGLMPIVALIGIFINRVDRGLGADRRSLSPVQDSAS